MISVTNNVAPDISTDKKTPVIMSKPDVLSLQKDSQFPGKKVTNSRVLKVVRKQMNVLKEIAGRKGCGPWAYTQWARLFRMEISLLDLLQCLPNFTKHVKKMSTRVNTKREPVKRQKRYEATVETDDELDVLIETALVEFHCMLNRVASAMEYPMLDSILSSYKPFRVPGVIYINVKGQLVALELPKHICQADQGSDINLISPYLVDYLNLEKFLLAPPGSKPGLLMDTADGNSTSMKSYVKAKFTVMGITRLVELFVRPDHNVKSKDKNILLGLPWLWFVDVFF
uniref:BgtA-21587 n=1 Tax=Blumeria graminis f. sp. tritici TaxID=62690 RepID=A0A0P0FL92_BLUGR|nr:BgtA-21587 [Blumeria graminis f. sp. tritici]